MSKEGSLGAPIRHPIDFEHPDFLNPEKLDAEMRRVFDICHGCRRCFNLCDSFPKLFDMIDESKNEDVESLSSDQFAPVVDACTLCDMCFMTKCPYVPPHDFDLDFPHLMLRYRTAQKKLGKLPSVPTQLAQIDRNAKIGIMFSKIVNWASNIKNKLIRKILELITGIDKRVQLPKYNSETFSYFFKKNKDKINYLTPSRDRKVVIYSTCFVNFNKRYKVVTLTASCGLMLKFEWPLLLPNDEKIKKLSSNVMDIDEYVVDIANNEGLAEGLNEIDGGVTVHHACHARAQNMGIKARDMLKLIPNIKIDVVERCAGHGGTFGVMKETHDLANKVGRPTARQIKTKNNKYMASDCPLAGKHLKQLEVDTNISNDEALHPIELVAKSYNL